MPTITWPNRMRRAGRAQTGRFAVRVEWPDGTHTFECLSRGYWPARRQIDRLRGWWRLGPIPPSGFAVVALTVAEFDTHRRAALCRDPACPTGGPAT